MNYNSMQEILNASTNNMRVVIDNDRTISGSRYRKQLNFFQFAIHGEIITDIRVGSDYSTLYFSKSSDMTRLDISKNGEASLYYLYEEEGTLYDYYKFLKIRWRGYSDYLNEVEETKLEFDIILLDTGDICVHMISIPSKNIGSYNLQIYQTNYPYSVSADNPDVWFKQTENNFEVIGGIINNLSAPPYYLIRSNSSYYSVIDNALNLLEVPYLTSDTFKNLNMRVASFLPLLTQLDSPEVLIWYDTNNTYVPEELVATGYPLLPQMVEFDSQDMTNYSGIANVDCPISYDVLFTISVDEGQTWKYYNEGEWVEAVENLEGMTNATLLGIVAEDWAQLITESTPSYKFRCALTAKESRLGKIYVKYI